MATTNFDHLTFDCLMQDGGRSNFGRGRSQRCELCPPAIWIGDLEFPASAPRFDMQNERPEQRFANTRADDVVQRGVDYGHLLGGAQQSLGSHCFKYESQTCQMGCPPPAVAIHIYEPTLLGQKQLLTVLEKRIGCLRQHSAHRLSKVSVSRRRAVESSTPGDAS